MMPYGETACKVDTYVCKALKGLNTSRSIRYDRMIRQNLVKIRAVLEFLTLQGPIIELRPSKYIIHVFNLNYQNSRN